MRTLFLIAAIALTAYTASHCDQFTTCSTCAGNAITVGTETINCAWCNSAAKCMEKSEQQLCQEALNAGECNRRHLQELDTQEPTTEPLGTGEPTTTSEQPVNPTETSELPTETAATTSAAGAGTVEPTEVPSDQTEQPSTIPSEIATNPTELPTTSTEAPQESTELPTEEPSASTEPTTRPTEIPATEQPETTGEATAEPATQEPATQEPATPEPGTQEPGTQEPATQEPATQEPSTEEPSGGGVTAEPFSAVVPQTGPQGWPLGWLAVIKGSSCAKITNCKACTQATSDTCSWCQGGNKCVAEYEYNSGSVTNCPIATFVSTGCRS